MNIKILKCYDMREYKKNYYKNNKEKWDKKAFCQICNKEYNKNNKWQHNNTKTHKMNAEKNENNIEFIEKIFSQ